MTALAQSMLFLSSFSPLFAVFALLDSFGEGWPSVVCAGLAGVGLVLPVVVLRAARRIASQSLHVGTVQVRDGDALAYIATYLVPFAATTATTARARGALGLFVGLVAVLYVRSEFFYVNPLFAAVNYRIFQVTTPAGASVVLLTHRRFVSSNTTVNARRLGSYIYWEDET